MEQIRKKQCGNEIGTHKKENVNSNLDQGCHAGGSGRCADAV